MNMKSGKLKLFNIIGLLFGMIGVVIIFFYGPPQPNFFPYEIITDSNIHQDVLDIKNKYDIYSKLGLGFIFIGFLLQLLAVIFSGGSNIKSSKNIQEPKSTLTEELNNSIEQ